MSKLDIIRAWKDDEYFNKLSESERSLLPQNPAGVVELTDQDLHQAEGGTTFSLTFGCDTIFTFSCFSILDPFCSITIMPADTQLD